MANREITYYSLLSSENLRHIEQVADTMDEQSFVTLGFEQKWFHHLWIGANNEAFLEHISHQTDLNKLDLVLGEQLKLYARKRGEGFEQDKGDFYGTYKARKDWLNHTIFICKNEYNKTQNEVFNEVVKWCVDWQNEWLETFNPYSPTEREEMSKDLKTSLWERFNESEPSQQTEKQKPELNRKGTKGSSKEVFQYVSDKEENTAYYSPLDYDIKLGCSNDYIDEFNLKRSQITAYQIKMEIEKYKWLNELAEYRMNDVNCDAEKEIEAKHFQDIAPNLMHQYSWEILDFLKNIKALPPQQIEKPITEPKENDFSKKIKRLKSIWLPDPKLTVEDFLQKGNDKRFWNDNFDLTLNRSNSNYGTGKTFLGNVFVALKNWSVPEHLDYKEAGKIFCEVFNVDIKENTKEPYKAFCSGNGKQITEIKRTFGVK